MTYLFNTRPVSHSAARDYLRGASSILNVSGKTGREYKFAPSDREADCEALSNDWDAIGGDLEAAIAHHAPQYKRHGN